MPKITAEESYGAAAEKISRLGLTALYEEVKRLVSEFPLTVEERKDANSSATVRKKVDAQFKNADG